MTEKKKRLNAGWEPEMMTEEETMAFLDSKGIAYEICDTPIPVLENKVRCGKPQDIGDLVVDEYRYIPRSRQGRYPMMDVPAIGDSMIGADIYDGDWMQLECGRIPSDGDVVIARIDGEMTAKVFFTDEQNHYWLLPKNENYDPIELNKDDNVRIAGVVSNLTKSVPSQSHNECVSILKRYKNKKAEAGDVFHRLAKVVGDGKLLFWAASAWAVVYGVARDCYNYEGTVSEFERKAETMKLPMRFDYPCSEGKVQRTISNHPYMRLHIDKWKENGASVREIVLMEFLRKNL